MPESVATLTFPYPSAERARSVAAAIEREAGDIEGGRTVATVSREDCVVTVEVHARDLTALRAGANTWTALVEAAERVAAAASRHRD